VIEALGVAGGGLATSGFPTPPGDAGRRWLEELAPGLVHEDAALPFGAALHLGEMFWGNIGAADRLDLSAIGPPSIWSAG
jgi:adenylate cyclase